MRFSPTLALLSLFATLSVAVPVLLEKRDVFVPPILQPAAGDVWTKGTNQTVVWDVSNVPAQLTNPLGSIYLRNDALEVIFLDSPLAQGFDITLGQWNVSVPTNISAGAYNVVIVGDSGDWSPLFGIQDPEL